MDEGTRNAILGMNVALAAVLEAIARQGIIDRSELIASLRTVMDELPQNSDKTQGYTEQYATARTILEATVNLLKRPESWLPTQ